MITPFYEDSLKSIYEVLPIITNFGLSAAVIFLSTQINRVVSKEIFEHLFFNDELKMPTTEYLLWINDYLDTQIKEALHKKIKEKLGIELLSELDERSNEHRARKINATAVSQIRNKLRDNPLLFQHNIEYGFFRNLIGGSFLATFISIFITVYSYFKGIELLFATGIILLLVYLIPIILSKFFIKRYGNYYSKILFEQYLSL
ncbi:hypothetical protein [Rufibacter quisquiliarum]|uniref:Uncharacterized protein n=1 Tax=Rufibacter quisquiliarum TaxID=1549639 RepID=A0A839GTH0_9BACT|nr:hypothetical protein [Rufibacter quisquiliarum]MBA9077081.1 hypothetical protein [Rufibacter quisquiliarum]